MTSFTELFNARFAAGKYICVGLDPDVKQIPACVPGNTDTERVYNFLTPIIEATSQYAAAFKPQSAYYEGLGTSAQRTLRSVIAKCRATDASVPVILDYKRGDIGRTNQPYVKAAFDFYGADAVTVHPYLGMEAMMPFLEQTDKTIIVLCRTSNDGAGEFQDILCTAYMDLSTGVFYSTPAEAAREGAKGGLITVKEVPLYAFVAKRVATAWNLHGNCAVVVGATAPSELKAIRKIVGNMPILIPGIGTQGGDLATAVKNGQNSNGEGYILNNSSAILFAYAKLKENGVLKYAPEQFAEAAAEAARTMNDVVGTVLTAL